MEYSLSAFSPYHTTGAQSPLVNMRLYNTVYGSCSPSHQVTVTSF